MLCENCHHATTTDPYIQSLVSETCAMCGIQLSYNGPQILRLVDPLLINAANTANAANAGDELYDASRGG